MATYTAQILKIAPSIISVLGNTSYIKVPYKSLGIAQSFLSVLTQNPLQGVQDLIEHGGVCRIDLNMVSFTKRGKSDVSKNIIYSASGQGSKYITDNIVPYPWEMTLEAEIPFEGDIGGIVADILGYAGIGNIEVYRTTVLLRKKVIRTLLEKAFEGGVPVAFKDDSNNVYNECAIQNIEFLPTAESENHLRVRLTLVEMRTLSSAGQSLIREIADMAKIGSMFGDDMDLGSSIVTAVGEGLQAVTSTLSNLFGLF